MPRQLVGYARRLVSLVTIALNQVQREIFILAGNPQANQAGTNFLHGQPRNGARYLQFQNQFQESVAGKQCHG